MKTPDAGSILVGAKRSAGSGRRRVWQVAQQADPVRLALFRPVSDLRFAVVCIYRGRNAHLVRRMVGEVPPHTTVRLWSLDGVIPDELRTLTVGTGPGNRFALLNTVMAQVPPAARRDGLLLVDDDIRFVVGSLAQLVLAARRAGLDLYQPAHSARSFANWAFVRRRALSYARRTDFVEQGPLVGLSERAQQVLLPLPEDLGMGWGVEVRWWTSALRHGLHQGIVDAVAVQHMSPTAEDYDRSAGEQTLAAELSAAGLDTITSLQQTLSHIRPWSAVPRQPVAPDAAPLARGEAAPALLSVVIPTRSRRDQVVALVRALLDDPALLEVIVVVDGEDQPTFAALVALAASSPRLVPIQQPHGGAGAARQNGVQLAHGDVVLLLDDDVVPAPGLVSAHAAQHQAAPGRLVVGSLPPVRAPRRTVHSVVDEIYAVDYDVCYRDYVTNPHSVLEHLWAGNMSLDRNVALEVGIGDAAFDSLFFEDRDLGLRLRRAGVKAVFCPELRADHHHVGTLTGYLRDSLRQGRALVLLRRRYPDEVPEPTVRGIAGKFPWPARALVWGSHRSPDRTGRVVCGLLLGASYLAGVLRMYQLQRPLVVLLRRTAQARGAAWARQALAPC